MFIFIMPRIVESSPELADIYQRKRDTMEEVKEGSGDVPEQIFQVTPNQEHVFAFIDLGFAKLQQKKYPEAFTNIIKLIEKIKGLQASQNI